MNTQVREQILQKMREAWPNLSKAEKAMATLLAHQTSPIQQDRIAKCLSVGPHPVFDTERYRSTGSTLRQVRQIIHDLKVNHRILVVSSRAGYWIPNTLDEIEEYMDAFEKQARAAARSYMVTYHSMRQSVEGLKERDVTKLFELEAV